MFVNGHCPPWRAVAEYARARPTAWASPIGGWTGDTRTADVCLVTPPHHVRVTIDAGRESFVFDDDGTWIRTIIDATRRPTRAGRASHSNVAWIQSQAVRSCRDIPAESLN